MEDTTEIKTAETQPTRSRRGLWIGVLVVLIVGVAGWVYLVRSGESRAFQAAQQAVAQGEWETAVSALNETLTTQPAFLQQYTTQATALRGIAHYYLGNPTVSQTDLSTALAENSNLVDLYVYQAALHQSNGANEEALADAQQALNHKELLPAHLLALAYTTQSLAQNAQGQLADAGDSAGAALELSAHLPQETVAKLYAIRAMAKFADGDATEAAADARLAFATDVPLPEEQQAVLYAAQTAVFFDGGDLVAALTASQSALDLSSHLTETAVADLHRIRAEIYWQQGDINSAVTEAEQAASDETNQSFYHALHSWQTYRAFDYDTAFQEASTAISQDPENALAYRVRGTIYVWRGELANGLADLNQAIALAPDDVEALAMRVHTLLNYFRLAEAEADLAHMESIAPNAPATLWAKSQLITRQTDDRPFARALINQAIALDDQRPEFFLHRSQTYRLTADDAISLADLEQALALHPNFPPAIIEKLFYELENFNTDNYLAVGEQLVEKYPDSYLGYAILAGYYAEEGQDLEQALDYANQCINLDPDLPQAYVIRGGIYLDREEYDLAQQDFEHVLELRENHIHGLDGLALTLTLQQRYEEALTYREQIMDLLPNSLRAKSDVGFAAWEAGDVDRAWELAHTTLAIDPDQQLALMLRATLLYEMGEYEDALTDVQRVLELYPNYPWPHILQGRVLIELGEWQEAKESIERGLELDETLIDGHMLLAFIALNEGDIDVLFEQLELFIAAADEVPTYAYALQAYGYGQQAEYDKVVEALTSGILIDATNGQLYIDRANAYQLLGEIDLAIEDLQTVLDTSHDLTVLAQAEVNMVYMQSTGASAEGRTLFNNPDFGFSLSYADFWERDISSPEALSTLMLSYGTDETVASFRVISFGGVEGFTVQSLVDAVLSQVDDPAFQVLSQSTSSLAGETAVIVEYELDITNDQGEIITLRGRQYFVIYGDVVVLMSGEAALEDFEDYSAEFDAIATSLTIAP